MGAGRVEVAASIGGEGAAPAGPGIVVLRPGRVIDPFLNVGQDLRVPRAKVAFRKRNSSVTDVPGIPVSRGLAGPFANHLEVLILSGGEQEQHADASKAFGRFRPGKIIGHPANNPVRLRAVKGPGLAVGAEDGDLDDDRVGLALDGELENPIGCLCRGKELPELDARVDVCEFLAVDGLDDLPRLQFPGRGGRRTWLDVGDAHNKGRLEQVDAHADRAEALDVGERLGFPRARGEDAVRLLVE